MLRKDHVMNSVFFSGLLLLASSSAMACLQPEAQIIATITQVERTTQACVARVSPETLRFFASSYVCPLDIDEVLAEGVNVGIVNGHECALQVGDELNGIVYRDQAGLLRIE
jgi:hypothetical protein